MSIANVVTRGYGPSAAIRWVVTKGYWEAAASVTAAVGGGNLTAADIVSGGSIITLTLNNATWAAAGATFDAERQNIIDGMTSNGVEATGWNAVVRDAEVVTAVVRTSNTVVTITLSAAATYSVTTSEVVTVTIPASATSDANSVVALPTFIAGIVPAVGEIYRFTGSKFLLSSWRK